MQQQVFKCEPVQRKRGKGLTIEQLVRDAYKHITFEIQRLLMPGALARSFSQPLKIYWRLIVSPVVHAIEIVQQIGHVTHGIRAVKADLTPHWHRSGDSHVGIEHYTWNR